MLRHRVFLSLLVVVGTAKASPQFPQSTYLQQTLRGGAVTPGFRTFCNAACPRIYIPVCGSDGKTYSSNCVLDYYQCAFGNVTYAYPGECAGKGGRDQSPCPLICPYLYAPVCGSDGVTYPNSCTMDAAACKDSSITLQYHGQCENIDQVQQKPCPTSCPFDYAPVCGNDGNTYANLCTFESSACRDSSLRVVANRPCGSPTLPRTPCPLTCPGNYDPVCGSDGNTYGNKCTLDLVSCRDPSVTLVNSAECGAPFNRCPDVCAEKEDAVCGSDGVTYRNECVFRAATCRDTTMFPATSTQGQCASPPERPCPVLCPARYRPVCGTDGQTYPNQCVLESEACNDPSLAIATQGECVSSHSQPPSNTSTRSFTPRPPPATTTTTTTIAPTFILLPPRLFCPNDCDRNFSPVCGSDGETYYNQCLLFLTGCREQRQLSIAYLGRCVDPSER